MKGIGGLLSITILTNLPSEAKSEDSDEGFYILPQPLPEPTTQQLHLKPLSITERTSFFQNCLSHIALLKGYKENILLELALSKDRLLLAHVSLSNFYEQSCQNQVEEWPLLKKIKEIEEVLKECDLKSNEGYEFLSLLEKTLLHQPKSLLTVLLKDAVEAHRNFESITKYFKTVKRLFEDFHRYDEELAPQDLKRALNECMELIEKAENTNSFLEAISFDLMTEIREATKKGDEFTFTEVMLGGSLGVLLASFLGMLTIPGTIAMIASPLPGAMACRTGRPLFDKIHEYLFASVPPQLKEMPTEDKTIVYEFNSSSTSYFKIFKWDHSWTEGIVAIYLPSGKIHTTVFNLNLVGDKISNADLTLIVLEMKGHLSKHPEDAKKFTDLIENLSSINIPRGGSSFQKGFIRSYSPSLELIKKQCRIGKS